MSSNVVRPRIFQILSKISNRNCSKYRRGFSSDTVSGAPKKEPIIASQSIVGDISAPPEVEAAEEAAAPNEVRKSSWRFLTYGIVATLTGVTAGAGYLTYGEVIFFPFYFIFGIWAYNVFLDMRAVILFCVFNVLGDKILP